MMSSHRATIADNMSKLGHTGVMCINLEVKVDITHYSDLLASFLYRVYTVENCAPPYRGGYVFIGINILQGSIARPLKYGEICDDFLCKFHTDCSSVIIWKIGRLTWRNYGQEFSVLKFFTHDV